MTPEPKKWLKDWYNEKYPEHGWFFHLNESTGINFEKVYLFMEQYAKDYIAAELEEAKARVKELEDGLKELMEGVAGLPPLTAIAGVLEKQYSAAKQLLNQK